MSFNRVILLGNLGADPELRYTASQVAVCTLNIATNERRKNSEGEWADHTEWHKVVTFGKTAENCGQYLAKGRSAFVEGRIQTRKWTDKEGNDRYTTEVVASTVKFVGGQRGGDSMQVEKSFVPNKGAPQASNPAPAFNEAVSFDDDDIPF